MCVKCTGPGAGPEADASPSCPAAGAAAAEGPEAAQGFMLQLPGVSASSAVPGLPGGAQNRPHAHDSHARRVARGFPCPPKHTVRLPRLPHLQL